ncbi:hypothetical protein BLNAU_1973 [Blattamonas nauphoetae]|uniref:Uncharacterized protein n=1 Tax=Blattamonas nauphoetae TaxID=2049346 RepID=A0ABQ9YGR9_9EUKA|nr:hypothetical protein BLNAU_1973 [Blattamonas nauphoetae]
MQSMPTPNLRNDFAVPSSHRPQDQHIHPSLPLDMFAESSTTLRPRPVQQPLVETLFKLYSTIVCHRGTDCHFIKFYECFCCM